MGKKSKSKKKGNNKVKRAGNSNNNDTSAAGKLLSQDDKKDFTIEDIQQLPFEPNHIWKVTRFGESPSSSALFVMDMTRTLYDLNDISIPMKIIALPDVSTSNGQQIMVQTILNAMGTPYDATNSTTEIGQYFRPRRPFTILIDPQFQPAFAYVKGQIEQVGDVDVELFTQENLSISLTAALYIPFIDNYTWNDVALMNQDLLVQTVKQLLQQAEIWTCGVFIEDENSLPMIAIEKTPAGSGMPLGMGKPFPPRLAHMALMSVMLAPMDKSDKRRPHTIIFQPSLAKHFDFYKRMMIEVGVRSVLQS